MNAQAHFDCGRPDVAPRHAFAVLVWRDYDGGTRPWGYQLVLHGTPVEESGVAQMSPTADQAYERGMAKLLSRLRSVAQLARQELELVESTLGRGGDKDLSGPAEGIR